MLKAIPVVILIILILALIIANIAMAQCLRVTTKIQRSLFMVLSAIISLTTLTQSRLFAVDCSTLSLMMRTLIYVVKI